MFSIGTADDNMQVLHTIKGIILSFSLVFMSFDKIVQFWVVHAGDRVHFWP